MRKLFLLSLTSWILSTGAALAHSTTANMDVKIIEKPPWRSKRKQMIYKKKWGEINLDSETKELLRLIGAVYQKKLGVKLYVTRIVLVGDRVWAVDFHNDKSKRGVAYITGPTFNQPHTWALDTTNNRQTGDNGRVIPGTKIDGDSMSEFIKMLKSQL
jgi:hypothetical protein